jgi:hypothetical protein
MIIKNVCPCIGCVHLTISDVSYVYWCKKKDQSVVQAYGNPAHHDGQWLIPCGRDMFGYKDVKEDVRTD